MSEPEGRAGLTDKLDADVRAPLGRIARLPQLLVACDYDGTLAPLVDDPTRAEPLPEAVAAIRALATLPQTTVAVVSGRALRDLATLSRLPSEVHLARQARLRVRPGLHPAARAGDDRVAPPAVRGSGDDLERPSGCAAGGEAGECRGPYARGERAVAERVLDAVRCGPVTWPDIHVTHGKEVEASCVFWRLVNQAPSWRATDLPLAEKDTLAVTRMAALHAP